MQAAFFQINKNRQPVNRLLKYCTIKAKTLGSTNHYFNFICSQFNLETDSTNKCKSGLVYI